MRIEPVHALKGGGACRSAVVEDDCSRHTHIERLGQPKEGNRERAYANAECGHVHSGMRG